MLPPWSGWAATKRSIAVTKAASEVFMSAAPRPYSTPSLMVGLKGVLQASAGPGGTTSVWPAKHSTGAVGAASRPQVADATAVDALEGEAERRRRSAMSSRQPASSGVTEGRAMSSAGQASVAWGVINSTSIEKKCSKKCL